MKTQYHVTATRVGRWWAIEVPELPGVHSQSRRLDQVESIAREAIALFLAVGEDAFDVTVEPDLESLGPLKDSIEEALAARDAAEVLSRRLPPPSDMPCERSGTPAIRHATRGCF